jgi:putative ATPase
MDLFEHASEGANQPLAYRMRPRTLDEYIGQDHIIGKGRLLRRAIQADQLSSVIFYGPPGTGKTTLARVIANTTKSSFATLNAVLSGVKELRYEIEEARSRMQHFGKRTMLFVDEVHRWNKSQQDALLPWVENGTFILIGATTENPYFEVNSALVSRSRIFQLLPLTSDDLIAIARQALADSERGYGKWKVEFEQGSLEHLVDIANGDARSLLNALELAVETTPSKFPPEENTLIAITREAAEESIQRKVVLYDKEGDYHFDIISAFIKSIRGSDPDAALYWMARMVHAGEDPKFIFRRMMISACEDIGMADPYAIMIVEADASAFERIGLPEGRFHLTHAALYLATAPKSNTAMGFFDALQAIEEEGKGDVPNHLKDGSRDKKGFGHGEGYLYPHAYHDHWVPQQYLPSSLQGKIFYQPSSMGYEAKIHDEVVRKRESQLEAAGIDAFPENLTFSPSDRERDLWARRAVGERGILLEQIRERIFAGLRLARHARVLVVNAGHGMLLWEAFRKTPEGLSMAFTSSHEHYNHLQHYAATLDQLSQPQVLEGDTRTLLNGLESGLLFEAIIGRNMLSRLENDKPILPVLGTRLAPDGMLALAEAVPSSSSRLSEFVVNRATRDLLVEAESHIYQKGGNPLGAWDERDLGDAFEEAGFLVRIEAVKGEEQRSISANDIRRWMEKSYEPVWKKENIECDPQAIQQELLRTLENRTVAWKHVVLLIFAGKKPHIQGKPAISENLLRST